MSNNSLQVDWMGNRYAMEQTSIAGGDDANDAAGDNKKGDDEVFLKLDFQLPALLLTGNKANMQIEDEV